MLTICIPRDNISRTSNITLLNFLWISSINGMAEQLGFKLSNTLYFISNMFSVLKKLINTLFSKCCINCRVYEIDHWHSTLLHQTVTKVYFHINQILWYWIWYTFCIYPNMNINSIKWWENTNSKNQLCSQIWSELIIHFADYAAYF